jgi:drug/metabolite transporter (DMT)-like permease
MIAGMGYAFAALACFGLGDFIYKRSAAAGVQAHHFLMAQAWCFCPVIILYAWATGTLVLRAPALWGSLAGLFIFIAFYNFLKSLATGPVSINAPIFRLNFIVTAALAVMILHEPVTLAMLVALALALAAIWLLLGGLDGASSKMNRASLIAVLIAMLALGAANFFHTVGLRHGSTPETLLAAQAVLFVSLATVFTRITDGAIRLPAATWKYAAPAALVLLAAFLFMLHGLREGPASVLVPVAQMGFVVPAALGIFLLRERLTARAVVGLAAALAALAVIAFG